MELISEEYKVKEFEKQVVRKLRYIMDDLGARRAMNKHYSDRYWKRDEHLWIISDHKDGDKKNRATFYGHRYDPSMSEITYGDTQAISDDKVRVDGFSKNFNNSESPIDTVEEVRHSVTLSRNVTHVMSTHIETSIKSSSKVSGSYAGAEFEQSIEISFGFALDNSKSVAESTDETEEVSHELTVPRGKKILVTFEKNKLVTETPFAVDGYIDMSLKLDFEDWASSKHKQGSLLFGTSKHKNVFRFGSILDFERFLRGYDVEHPSMRKYKPSDRAQEAMAWIFDKKNRLIQATGVKRREFENNVDISTAEIL